MLRYDIRTGVKKIKTKTFMVISGATLGTAGLAMAVAMPIAAKAAGTVVVTPTNTQGWSTADTRPGGSVTYVSDPSSPYPSGALQLTTDATNAAKAQYLHSASGPLTSVTQLSYSTKQVSGPAVADPSYQLPVCLGGVVGGNCVGFTNLVYEPYWNGTVTPEVWQSWDVSAGQFWSSSSYTDGSCQLRSGAGGPPFYTLAQVEEKCPSATVAGFGVNIGTYNPNYVVETDGVQFNDTVYNFELTNTPENKDACKNGGWMDATDQSGNAFKNQGQCVSWTEHNSGHGTPALNKPSH